MPDQNQATGPASLVERYREAAPLGAVWNAVIDEMVRHRSVRAYTAERLAPGTLETLVAAAQSAATSSNLQTWSVVAVEDQGRKDRLAALGNNQKHISEAPLFLCWVADLSRAARLGDAHSHTLEAIPFLETFIVAVIDAALAAQNAVVAAESLGLGTVYIGGMRNHPEAVAAELGLPPGSMVVFGLCVGYEDAAHPASVKPRLPQSVVLHRERYAVSHEAETIGVYDASLQAFQREQSMKPQGWSELVLNRLGPLRSMSGRDKLHAALQALGFPLR